MFAEERKQLIVQRIKKGETVKVAQISQQLGVSESTIRRDLQELEESGWLQRTHGGAILAQSSFEPSFSDKKVVRLAEKKAIARQAAQYIEEGEAVFLDSGTTTLELARLLKGRSITLATNSMEIARLFLEDEQVEVLLLGGTFRKSTRSLVGYLANEMLRKMQFDKVFIGVNGISTAFGLSTPHPAEAETKGYMVRSGKMVIAVADHAKVGQDALYSICELGQVDVLISDWGLDEVRQQELAKLVKVIIGTEEDGK